MDSQYFSPSDADLILRSASPTGHVDFRVHKCILSAGSSFFQQMFTLPQPSTSSGMEPEKLAVVDVSESHTTLETLLRFVYPLPDPAIESLDELTLVLDAAMKYEFVSVIESLRKLLVAPRFVEQHPTRVYAIAARFDMEEEAKIASRHTLTINILDCPLSDDLKFITAYSYHRLLDLHRRRAQAAQDLLEIPDSVKCIQCNGTHYGIFSPPKWWRDFQERAKEELRVRPTSDVIFSMPFLARSAKTGCERCAGNILESYGFLEMLKKRIDDLPSTI